MKRRIAMEFTPKDLERITAALDSHVYWQLSDPFYRADGNVRGAGSDDPAAKREIARVRGLMERLRDVNRG